MNFWDPNNIIRNINNQISLFEKQFSTCHRDELKATINQFASECINNVSDDQMSDVKFSLIGLFNNYSTYFECHNTAENVIGELEKYFELTSNDNKDYFNIRYLYGYAHINYYQFSPGEYHVDKSQLAIERLNKSKKIFYGMYTSYVENKTVLSNINLENTLIALCASLLLSYRFYEADCYLQILKNINPKPIEVNYLQIQILTEVKTNTCISYNNLINLRVIDEAKKAKRKDGNIKNIQLPSILKKEKESRSEIQTSGATIKELRFQYKKFHKSNKSINKYNQYFSEHNLFLTEHNFYCNCDSIYKDELQIETTHSHTQVDWIKNEQLKLNQIKHDFILSRKLHFDSLITSIKRGFNLNNSHSKPLIRISCLKSSFRLNYSLLDNLSFLILDSLKINYSKKIRQISFTKFWDLELISPAVLKENLYLRTLKSITEELDNTELAALKQFRKIRNLLEHRVLHVRFDIEDDDIANNSLPFDNLVKYNLILLRITKSAILTYIYMLRRKTVLDQECSS